MSDTNRQVADLYANERWPAVVTATDRRRRAIGTIVDVTDETLTVDRSYGPPMVFRHDEVLEIFPYQADGNGR